MWGGGATTAHPVQPIQAAGAGTTHPPGVVLRAARLRRLVTQQGGGEGAHRTPHLPSPWATARGRYATMQLANYLHHEMCPHGSAAAPRGKIVTGIASTPPQGTVGASPLPPILPARAAGGTWWRMVYGRDIGGPEGGGGGENPRPPCHLGRGGRLVILCQRAAPCLGQPTPCPTSTAARFSASHPPSSPVSRGSSEYPRASSSATALGQVGCLSQAAAGVQRTAERTAVTSTGAHPSPPPPGSMT